MKRVSLTVAIVVAVLLVAPYPASATVPDATQSYYVPEAGAVLTPMQGAQAIRFFRGCPNNDGASSFPNNARIKVVLMANGTPLSGVAAADIYVKLNGGTAVQHFNGDGADSIIANPTYNPSFNCPLVQYLFADAASDGNGVAYITFGGADPSNPGVTYRNPNRKWGHYDSELPVFALGVKLSGRLTTNGNNGDYVLRIKSFDVRSGLGTALDQGELVSSDDYNSVINSIGQSPDALTYWLDYDNTGTLTSTDLNAFLPHLFHTCNSPNNP